MTSELRQSDVRDDVMSGSCLFVVDKTQPWAVDGVFSLSFYMCGDSPKLISCMIMAYLILNVTSFVVAAWWRWRPDQALGDAHNDAHIVFCVHQNTHTHTQYTFIMEE